MCPARTRAHAIGTTWYCIPQLEKGDHELSKKKVYQNRTIIKEVISKNVIFLLTLALVLCSRSRSRSRYWNFMVLHTTIGKRRSRAFKQKKVYQNRTIIKEVISKNVIFLLVLALVSWYWYYMVLPTTVGKRRLRAFKQKKVYQNRTIIKENIRSCKIHDDGSFGMKITKYLHTLMSWTGSCPFRLFLNFLDILLTAPTHLYTS